MNIYCKWNNADFYPNCNRVKNELAEYSTEKLLYGRPIEILIQNYFNNEDIKIGALDFDILLRVAASCGLTKKQLENYLVLQGIELNNKIFDNRLLNLVKYGYLSLVQLRQLNYDFEVQLFDITNKGISCLKKSEPLFHDTSMEYFSEEDVFRYMRTKIVSNQISLHLLCSHRGLRTFSFQRINKSKSKQLDEEMIIAPLYIQTDVRNYLFEFVGNTSLGNKIFKYRMEQITLKQNRYPENTAIVIVAETYDHMKVLTTQMYSFERNGLQMDVLYTHDSEWFYEIPGQLFVMARAMGHSGLIRVNI